jgi:hypothetical protein
MFSKQKSQFSSIAMVIAFYFIALFTTIQSKALPSVEVSLSPQSSPTISPRVSPTTNQTQNDEPFNLYTDKTLTPYSPITLLACTRFQVKLIPTITSHIVRTGDYVEFKVLDDVKIKDGEKIKDESSTDKFGKAVILKDTEAIGYVSYTHKRHFLALPGRLEVKLNQVKAVDGQFVKVFIVRHYACKDEEKPCENYTPPCLAKNSTANYQATDRKTINDSNPEMVDETLQRSVKNRFQKPNDYIAGRTHPDFGKTITPGINATALIVGAADKKSTPLTILFGLFAAEGFAQLLAGTDSELDAGEIFDVYVTEEKHIFVKNADSSSQK